MSTTESPAESSPLVSIICRTMGRAELQQALRSIAAQDYPSIEIVIVDAKGNNALDYDADAGDRPVQLVNKGSALGRSMAANAGLDAANGSYILFLDDDDWIATAHISGLVNVLQHNKEFSAAYSNTQTTNADGESLDYVFEEDYDPILLMRDNFMPIHSVLFQKILLDKGCRFDESFDIYEDWDFWLQLSEHTDFYHSDAITAFYREGGDSETAAEDVSLRYQPDHALGKGRAAIFNKWLPKWTGSQVNALIGHLDQSVRLVEQDAQIHAELQRNAELQHGIETRDLQLEQLKLELSASVTELEQLQKHSELQARHIADLEQCLNSIYASPSWKLMGPARRLVRAFSSDKSGSDSDG